MNSSPISVQPNFELTFLNESCKSVNHSDWERNGDNKENIQDNQRPYEAWVSSFLLKVMTKKKTEIKTNN